MKISNKREYIEQQANDVYFIKKIKGQRGKKETFVKWQKKVSLFKRSLRTISKKVKTRKTNVMLVFVLMFNLVDEMIRVQKYFEVVKYFINPYWYGLS